MDRYSKFIFTAIALGLWVLVALIAFPQAMAPALVEAYGAQEVKIVGWSTNDTVKVDLKKIGGMSHWVALPIPVDVKD